MSDAQADAPPSLDEIDALLDEVMADTATLAWALDRPLLPREASAILARHAANPAAVQPGRSRETVFAAERQLRAQAASFAACAEALRAGDPALVPAGNPPGSGHDEVRELLIDADELRAMMPENSAEAAALDEEHRGLADAFERAGTACLARALAIQAERHRIHGADYQRVLVDALKIEEAEASQRAARAGKQATEARA